MTVRRMIRNASAASAVEFAITAPLFFLLIFAIIESGLLLWSQVNLQHGVALAARCASIDTVKCGTPEGIKNFAAENTFFGVSPSVFSVETAACGYRVTATYTFRFITSPLGVPVQTLQAQSCYPRRL
jgi:uncharacterized membrane protein